jgi:hypothetical protein
MVVTSKLKFPNLRFAMEDKDFTDITSLTDDFGILRFKGKNEIPAVLTTEALINLRRDNGLFFMQHIINWLKIRNFRELAISTIPIIQTFDTVIFTHS